MSRRSLHRHALREISRFVHVRPAQHGGVIREQLQRDAGAAAVIVIGSPATKHQKDIIGAVVSIACKIQNRAPDGEIAIGDIAFKNVHTNWRLRCVSM